METNNRPIGFFDSGVGGISVLREAVRLLPNEHFIYYGDDANAPYGVRSENEIRSLALASTDLLLERNVKCVVVACNTATSIAVHDMRQRYTVPVVSIEPAVKPAADAHPHGTIAVFATPATLQQRRFLDLVRRLGIEGRVRGVECPSLAGLIEREHADAPEIRAYVRERVSVLRDEPNVCALVMGCTHYTFASEVIRQEAVAQLRGACEVFDGAAGTARQVQKVLLRENALSSRRGVCGNVEFLSSAGPEAVIRMTQLFCQGRPCDGIAVNTER